MKIQTDVSDQGFAEARAKARRAKKVVDLVVKLMDAMASGRPLEASRILSRVPNALSQLKQVGAEIADLEGMAESARDVMAEARSSYKGDLEKALADGHLRWSGEWPQYLVEDVLPVRVDFRGHRVWVAGNPMNTLELAPVLDSILKAARGTVGQPFDAPQFLRQLVAAYEELRRGSQAREGAYLRVKELFNRYGGGKSTGVAWSQFGIDLYRLIQSGLLEKSGVQLEFSPARSPTSGLLVPGKGGGTYVNGVRLMPSPSSIEVPVG